MTELNFFRKNPHQGKMTKNGKKWPKNMVFGLFKKITSFVLSRICLKWKFLWLINILRKLHAWENSGSQVIAKKWLSMNEISVFFNRQYFTNRLTSDFDFWHVDRPEWKKQGSLTGFLKKIIIRGNGPFWAQKLLILTTLDWLYKFF